MCPLQLSTQFCPTETVKWPGWKSFKLELSTQFCPTETRFTTSSKTTHSSFHTILSYGNLPSLARVGLELFHFPHNSVLRKRWLVGMSAGLGIELFPHNSVLRKPTTCPYLYSFPLFFPHNSVLRKPEPHAQHPRRADCFPHNSVLRKHPNTGSQVGLEYWAFHTILSYGNYLVTVNRTELHQSAFHTILSYGNGFINGTNPSGDTAFHTILSYGNAGH